MCLLRTAGSEVWSQVENSCPQCRSRFRRFGEYNLLTGKRRVCEVQAGDSSATVAAWGVKGVYLLCVDALTRAKAPQARFFLGQERDQQGSESEDITCDVCGGAGEPNLLLLCDGRRGRCPGASHTFCDGLGRQARGAWVTRKGG